MLTEPSFVLLMGTSQTEVTQLKLGKLKVARQRLLQRYEHQTFVSCLAGLYGCQWRRYQLTHAQPGHLCCSKVLSFEFIMHMPRSLKIKLLNLSKLTWSKQIFTVTVKGDIHRYKKSPSLFFLTKIPYSMRFCVLTYMPVYDYYSNI